MRGMMLGGVMVVLAGLATVRSEEVKHNFRHKNFDELRLRYSPSEAHQFMQPEEEGLRIRFPPGSHPKGPTGVFWNCRVQGDFVATARYQILRADPSAQGTGVELYVMFGNPTRDGIPLSRLVRSKDGPVLTFMCMTDTEEGKRGRRDVREVPTTLATKVGALRLARQGKVCIASVAEGDDGPFTEFQRSEVGDAEVRLVRFAGLTRGNPNAELDVRLLEFTLQGELTGLPGKAAQPGALIPEQVPALTESGSGRWVLWVGLVLGLIVVVLFAVVLVVVRRKRGATPEAETVKDAELAEEEGQEEAPSKHIQVGTSRRLPAVPGKAIAVSCPECGKSLRCRRELAGKKIRCSQCSTVVPVPRTESAALNESSEE